MLNFIIGVVVGAFFGAFAIIIMVASSDRNNHES